MVHQSLCDSKEWFSFCLMFVNKVFLKIFFTRAFADHWEKVGTGKVHLTHSKWEEGGTLSILMTLLFKSFSFFFILNTFNTIFSRIKLFLRKYKFNGIISIYMSCFYVSFCLRKHLTPQTLLHSYIVAKCHQLFENIKNKFQIWLIKNMSSN